MWVKHIKPLKLAAVFAVFAGSAEAITINCLELEPILTIEGENLLIGQSVLIATTGGGSVESELSFSFTAGFQLDDLAEGDINDDTIDEVNIGLELDTTLYPGSRFSLTGTTSFNYNLLTDDFIGQFRVEPNGIGILNAAYVEIQYIDGEVSSQAGFDLIKLFTFFSMRGQCTPTSNVNYSCNFTQGSLRFASEAPAPVPLPASGALLLAGIGLVGGYGRITGRGVSGSRSSDSAT